MSYVTTSLAGPTIGGGTISVSSGASFAASQSAAAGRSNFVQDPQARRAVGVTRPGNPVLTLARPTTVTYPHLPTGGVRPVTTVVASPVVPAVAVDTSSASPGRGAPAVSPAEAVERPTTAPLTLPGTQANPDGSIVQPTFFETYQTELLVAGGLLAVLAVGYAITR